MLPTSASPLHVLNTADDNCIGDNTIQHDDNMDDDKQNELWKCPYKEGIDTGQQGATLQPQK